jgi:hypothetical protein
LFPYETIHFISSCRKMIFQRCWGLSSGLWAYDVYILEPCFQQFCSILKIGCWVLPRLVWAMILLYYTSPHCCDDRSVPPHTAFFTEIRSHSPLFLCWIGNWILNISASHVVLMAGALYCSSYLLILGYHDLTA